MEKIGAVKQPKKSRSTRLPPQMDPSLAEAAPKKQASLDMFLKQTAFTDDDRLARDMRAAKRVSAVAKAEAKAASAGPGPAMAGGSKK